MTHAGTNSRTLTCSSLWALKSHSPESWARRSSGSRSTPRWPILTTARRRSTRTCRSPRPAPLRRSTRACAPFGARMRTARAHGACVIAEPILLGRKTGARRASLVELAAERLRPTAALLTPLFSSRAASLHKGLLPPQARRGQEHQGSPARPQASDRQGRLPAPRHRRPPLTQGGPGRADGTTRNPA